MVITCLGGLVFGLNSPMNSIQQDCRTTEYGVIESRDFESSFSQATRIFEFALNVLLRLHKNHCSWFTILIINMKKLVGSD